MKRSITLIILVAFILPGCSTSPDKAIQKRWKAVDVEGNVRKKEHYANIFEMHSTEFELKNGKFSAYQDGAITGTADYTMAGDGKSVVVTENGRPEMTLRIISLNGDNMHAVMEGFMSGRDTIIFSAAGSDDMTMAKKRENDAWENVKRQWLEVQNEYQRKADLAYTLVKLIRGFVPDFDQIALKNFYDARDEAAKVNVSVQEITPEKIAEFQKAQSMVNGTLTHLLQTAQNYPALMSAENFKTTQSQLEGIENRITVAKRDFNTDVMIFNKIATANGSKTNDVNFKNNADSEGPADVNFNSK